MLIYQQLQELEINLFNLISLEFVELADEFEFNDFLGLETNFFLFEFGL